MAANPRYEEFISVVETWQVRRHDSRNTAEEGASASSLHEFVALMNAVTKRMMRELGVENPDFYSALVELGVHAQTMLAGGRVFVNGQDRTHG